MTLRMILPIIAALSLAIATGADACSCVSYRSRAEVDRTGDEVYRNAALIVEATVGDVSARYKAVCPAAGGSPRPGDIGRKVSGDRPITVHRVFKGRAPRSAVLVGAAAEVHAGGCSVMMNSCAVGIQSSARTILVLKRVEDGRFEMASYCSLMALRASTRGRAIFGTQ